MYDPFLTVLAKILNLLVVNLTLQLGNRNYKMNFYTLLLFC